MTAAAIADARRLLASTGYGDEMVVADYPVWLGVERGTRIADLVAFGRSSPRDMSTAAIVVSDASLDTAYELARAVAAPYFILARPVSEVWIAGGDSPRLWTSETGPDDVISLTEWMSPAAVLKAKVGLRQLPLFDLPVNFLADARSQNAERLAPLVGEALAAAADALPLSRRLEPVAALRAQHRRAARLVVGALTVLVMRDRDGWESPEVSDLVSVVAAQHQSTFSWLQSATKREHSLLQTLIDQLGAGINYKGLDPAILSGVYEEALVDDDDRKQLGIHYTPPKLAARLLNDLPVETVAPQLRHVLDPSCGSGTMLVAAHDRLRGLQPDNWNDDDRHRDLAVHLRGYDIDPFAVEIARLTLLLHAQPAGNGWQVDDRNTLVQPAPSTRPWIIVTNPPWKFTSDGSHVQSADRFLRWSLEALAPGGLLGVLLPGSWLSTNASAHSRADVMEQLDIFEVWRLPEGTFSTSAISTAVLFGRKRDGLGGSGARVVREVDKPTLTTFLAGGAATVTHTASAEVPLSEGPAAPRTGAATVPLGDVADIKSGAQPLRTIKDRGRGTPYLHQIGSVPPYGPILAAELWHVRYPDDFQRPRGASIIDKRKVIASAARSSSNPWRFRVSLDLDGVCIRNSARGIAPYDQNDDELLYAILVIVGSGYASAFAASFAGDRNISADVLKTLPIPTSRASLRTLGRLGRRAVQLHDDPVGLNKHLIRAEAAVWDAYQVSVTDRSIAAARLAGHLAAEKSPRYERAIDDAGSRATTFRRVGAVLDVEGSTARLWINGITDIEGLRVSVPAQMPGWLFRPGATFDVIGVDTAADLATARYSFQRESWQDLDLDSDEPTPLLAR